MRTTLIKVFQAREHKKKRGSCFMIGKSAYASREVIKDKG